MNILPQTKRNIPAPPDFPNNLIKYLQSSFKFDSYGGKMSKSYEYLVFLTKSLVSLQGSVRTINILDHPMTNKDLYEIESESLLGWQATNYKLLSVTGTFTYRFLITFINDASVILAINKTLDHQITTATIDKDYENIKQMVLNSTIPGVNADTFMVLLHQEIPED